MTALKSPDGMMLWIDQFLADTAELNLAQTEPL
jgi:hypothetical protein